jgi:hypothetical protein
MPLAQALMGKKALEKIVCYYESENLGTFNITVENYDGQTDSFSVDLIQYPDRYEEYFSTGVFVGEEFKFKFREDSLRDFVLKKVVVYFSLEPYV